jgi:DNA-binding NtrC family response regulator
LPKKIGQRKIVIHHPNRFELACRPAVVQYFDMSKQTLFVTKSTQINLDFLLKNELDLYQTLDQLEVSLILEAVKRCHGNYSAAARMLKVNRTTFMMKLYKLRHFDVTFPLEQHERESNMTQSV